MKLILVPLICSFSFLSPQPQVSGLREMMKDARKDVDKAIAFHKITSDFSLKDPHLLGFRAMSEFLLCDHSKNALSKYQHFIEGKKLLETAISAEPTNMELIYFRFSVQTNAPSFLGYDSNINADKTTLIAFALSQRAADAGLKQLVIDFLLHSTACSKEEKELVRRK